MLQPAQGVCHKIVPREVPLRYGWSLSGFSILIQSVGDAAAPCGKGGMLWSSAVLVNRAVQPLLGHNTSVSVRAMSCVGREI